MTLVAVIRSKPHVRVKNLIILNDEGFYELEVHIDEAEMAASGDPPGFIQKTMAEHLAGCVAETGLPLKEGLWNIAFTKWTQVHFNYPGGFTI